ncbi:MAG: hypothetical protein ACRC6F_03135 [Aeromonas sp.]
MRFTDVFLTIQVARNGGRSRGFGFVCFTSPEAAAQAISAMDGRVIANRRLNVAFSRVLDTPVSVSDCGSPPENQSLLPSGHFGVVPQVRCAAVTYQADMYNKSNPYAHFDHNSVCLKGYQQCWSAARQPRSACVHLSTGCSGSPA